MSTSAPTPTRKSELKILRDEPLYRPGIEIPETDAFAHAALAAALLRVLEDNPPPLSIGIFGKWGIGKSTVVNMLFRDIRQKADSDLFPVYFNAWKYSGDSFRRQFLIAVATIVYGAPDHAEVLRLESLNYTDVLKRVDKPWHTELWDALTAPSMKLRRSALVRIWLGVFLLLVGIFGSWFAGSPIPAIVSAALM